MVSIYLIFFVIIFTHLYKRTLFSLSPITLILDSVPDFLTKILPLPLINLSAIFIVFFISGLFSTPDSTFLYIVDAMNDTIKIFSILNELNWVSEDSVSNFGTPDRIVFSGKNFTGRLEYQLLIKN